MAQIDFFIIGRLATFFVPLAFFLILVVAFYVALRSYTSFVPGAAFKLAAVKELTSARLLSAGFISPSAISEDLLEQFVLQLGFCNGFFLLFVAIIVSCFFVLPGYVLRNAADFVWGVGGDVYGGGLALFNNVWVNFSTIFVLTALSNVIGLAPFSFTITSSVVVPFFFSLTLFFACCYVLVSGPKLSLFAGFLPAGTTTAIAPLIIVIEIVSNVAKFISLGVRLFANMFAGHLLLKVFYTMSYLVATSINLFMGFVGPFVFGFTGLIIVLEVLIAVLQAFVLLLLGVLYFKESEGYTLSH